jgi:hypothetical protein
MDTNIPDELSLSSEGAAPVSAETPRAVPTMFEVRGALQQMEQIGHQEAELDRWYANAKGQIAGTREFLADVLLAFMHDLRRTGEKRFTVPRNDEQIWAITSVAKSKVQRRDDEKLISLIKEKGLWDEDTMMPVPKPPAPKPAWKEIMSLVEFTGDGRARFKKKGAGKIPADVLQKVAPDVPIKVEVAVAVKEE